MWEVKRIFFDDDNEEAIIESMEDGWEPYAVIYLMSLAKEVMWFRRQKDSYDIPIPIEGDFHK